MVNEDTLKKIDTEFKRLCIRHGIVDMIDVKNLCESRCMVSFSKHLSNTMEEEIDHVMADLLDVPEIYDVITFGPLSKDMVYRGEEVRKLEIIVRPGFWTHSHEDYLAFLKLTRELRDPEYMKQKEKEVMAIRRACWKDYIIPLPPPDGSLKTETFLVLKNDPYDWIDVGYNDQGYREFKRCEMREYTPAYVRKFLSHPIKTVLFQRGYGGKGRGKPAQMRFEVKRIDLWDPVQEIYCDPHDLVEGILPKYIVLALGNRLM